MGHKYGGTNVPDKVRQNLFDGRFSIHHARQDPMNDGGSGGDIPIGINDLMEDIRKIDAALLEAYGADRNDAIASFHIQARCLRIKDDKIRLSNRFIEVEALEGLEMIPYDRR